MINKDIHICFHELPYLELQKIKWKKLNPEWNIHIYNDDMCRDFLKKEYDSIFVEIFNYIKSGSVRADFFRICILYKKGGVYMDADIEPKIPIENFLSEHIDFMSVYYEDEWKIVPKGTVLNPEFIASKPNNIFLKKCIDTYIDMYKNNKPYDYVEWSIVKILSMHLRNFGFIWNGNHDYKVNDLNIRMLFEPTVINFTEAHVLYKNIICFYDRTEDYIKKYCRYLTFENKKNENSKKIIFYKKFKK